CSRRFEPPPWRLRTSPKLRAKFEPRCAPARRDGARKGNRKQALYRVGRASACLATTMPGCGVRGFGAVAYTTNGEARILHRRSRASEAVAQPTHFLRAQRKSKRLLGARRLPTWERPHQVSGSWRGRSDNVAWAQILRRSQVCEKSLLIFLPAQMLLHVLWL